MDSVLRSLGRLILRIRKYDAVADRIKTELKWLFTNELYEYRLLCLMFKIARLNNVPYFEGSFIPVENTHMYNTRNTGKFSYVCKPRLAIGQRAFQFKGVQLWNKLPENIKHCFLFKI